MYEINLVDRSFDQEAAGPCSISLQANQSGLTYCITDETVNSYILFRKHRFEHVYLNGDIIDKTAEILDQESIFDLPFQSVRFIGYTQQSTLVPETYFDKRKMKDYLAFNCAGEMEGELFCNHLVLPGIYNVFALPEELISLITRYFKKVECTNQTTPFLRHITSRKNALEQSAVYIGLNAGFFDIAATGQGKLLLYNSFQYSSEHDLLYYVIFVINQMKFDPLQVPLFLSGELSSRLTYYEILKQYVPGTKYDDVFGTPQLAPGLKSLTPYRFLNLLNLNMCVSSEEHTEDEE
jgi:hypothetical protein